MEQYTQLKWYDMNDDGTKGSLYNPTSENIPQYKLKPENDLNQSRPDWHTLEENFIKDDEMATKIYNSYQAFKQDVIQYHEISEKAFIEMRDLEE